MCFLHSSSPQDTHLVVAVHEGLQDPQISPKDRLSFFSVQICSQPNLPLKPWNRKTTKVRHGMQFGPFNSAPRDDMSGCANLYHIIEKPRDSRARLEKHAVRLSVRKSRFSWLASKFHFHLPNGEGPTQVVSQLSKEETTKLVLQGKQIWELLVQKQAGIPHFLFQALGRFIRTPSGLVHI